MRSLLLYASALAVVSACGTKGPLTLPPPKSTVEKPAPADNTKPAEAPRR